MSRNGSGVYSLPEPPFVPATPISSSAVNSDFSDIASALTGSVASDGQTTITGPLKGYAGSVALPGYSFSNDTNTGIYRIGADNLGISVGGTKIVDISSTGISITGTFTPTGQFLVPDGTVLLPEYSFTNDPDSGLYRIGANNLGVAVNAAKVLDISTTGLDVIGNVSSNGSLLAPAAAGAMMINGSIVESHAGNAVTFALKTLAGTDPSTTNPVYFFFRNVTAATGDYTVVQATAAASIVVSSGSTLGFVNSIPAKVWIVMFNDGGTLRLGVINCVSGTNIYPLGQFPIASSTAEGGAGGADSAQVFYTGTAVASKAYVPIAYASYETGLAAAGSWASSPTRLQLFTPSVPLPGISIQRQRATNGVYSNTATTWTINNTTPQNTVGFQILSQAITPTSAANLLEIIVTAVLAESTADLVGLGLWQDSVANALTAAVNQSVGAGQPVTNSLNYTMLAATTSATTFKARAGGASTTYVNGTNSAGLFNGLSNTQMKITEIMT